MFFSGCQAITFSFNNKFMIMTYRYINGNSIPRDNLISGSGTEYCYIGSQVTSAKGNQRVKLLIRLCVYVGVIEHRQWCHLRAL